MCARDTREHVHSQVSGLHSQQILSLIPLTVSGQRSTPARLPLDSRASWSASRHFRPPRGRPGVPLPPLWLLRGASRAPPRRQSLQSGGPGRHGATQRPVSASRLIVSRFPGSALCCPAPSAQQPAPASRRPGVPATTAGARSEWRSAARLLGARWRVWLRRPGESLLRRLLHGLLPLLLSSLLARLLSRVLQGSVRDCRVLPCSRSNCEGRGVLGAGYWAQGALAAGLHVGTVAWAREVG